MPTVPELIQGGQWPLDPSTPLPAGVEPVETTPRFSDFPPDIQALFERAFKHGHKDPKRRPSATEWADTLEAWATWDKPTATERLRAVVRVISRLVWLGAWVSAIKRVLGRLRALHPGRQLAAPQVKYRRLVAKDEIKTLPAPDWAQGTVSGYFSLPEIGAYRADVKFREGLPPPPAQSSTAEFDPRPPDHEELLPFSRADLARLGIPDTEEMRELFDVP